MKRLLLTIFVSWIAGLLYYICLIPSLPSAVSADAIVVFTGGADRVYAGGALLQQNQGQYLFISGVTPGVDRHKLFESQPLESQRITLGHQAHDTWGNVLETKKWIEHYGFRSMYLVTAHYHLPRAVLLLKQELPNVNVIPYPVVTQEFKATYWWSRPKTLLKFMREYHKFLLTRLQFYSLFAS